MSVTIIQTPDQHTPGYNEQIFLVSGTVAGKNNYKYIFNIYDATGTNKICPSIKIPPRPSDNWAAFDAGRIVESFLASDIQILNGQTEGFKTNDNSYYAYKVKVGEEFDISTTGVTSYPDIATSSGVIFAWNAAYPFNEFHDYNPLTRISGDETRLYLTSSYINYAGYNFNKINSNENAWLYCISSATDDIEGFAIFTYSATNVLLGLYLVTNDYKTYSTEYNRKFLRFPSGTKNLNQIPSGSIGVITGSLPIITSNVASYNIRMGNNGFNASAFSDMSYVVADIANISGSVVHPYILNGCSKYESYRVHFLNKFGGFDSFTFNKVSKQNESIERKQYKKIYGSIEGRWSYNKYDRGAINYNTSIKDTLTLNSDWIIEAESEWLEQLIVSPEVYLDINNELIAVNITNSSYEKKKTINDKIFNLTIELEYSQKRFTQRG